MASLNIATRIATRIATLITANHGDVTVTTPRQRLYEINGTRVSCAMFGVSWAARDQGRHVAGLEHTIEIQVCEDGVYFHAENDGGLRSRTRKLRTGLSYADLAAGMASRAACGGQAAACR